MSAAPTGLLGRLGGMVLHPRRTLEATLAAPGSTATGVFVVGCLVGLSALPFSTGRAVAMVQISVMVSLSGLLGVLARTVLWELVAITLLAWALTRATAKRPNPPDPEGINAAAALTLVPFFLLMLLGALLERLGVGAGGALGRAIAVLPQVPWRGLLHGPTPGGYVALKLVVAYAPTTILLAWLTIRLLGRRNDLKPSKQT